MKYFYNLFDKKRFKSASKIVLLFLFLVIIFNIVCTTYSRYESDVSLSANANIAYFIVREGTTSNQITLSGLIPSYEPFDYVIKVSNFDENGNKANVDLKYNLEIKTTTNLPLQFELYKGDSTTNMLSSSSIVTDNDHMIYIDYPTDEWVNYLHGSKQTTEYTLRVYFPIYYKSNADLYQGKIDLVTVILNAEQLV